MWSKISSQYWGYARDLIRMISRKGRKWNAFHFLKGEIHCQGFIQVIRWSQAFNLALGIQHRPRGHWEGEQGASALEQSSQGTSSALPPGKPWQGTEDPEPHFIKVKWGRCTL